MMCGMAKYPGYPVRIQVNVMDVQAQRIFDFRQELGCETDSEMVWTQLTAMFDILDRDPDRQAQVTFVATSD